MNFFIYDLADKTTDEIWNLLLITQKALKLLVKSKTRNLNF